LKVNDSVALAVSRTGMRSTARTNKRSLLMSA
jgi:hypothetical protein